MADSDAEKYGKEVAEAFVNLREEIDNTICSVCGCTQPTDRCVACKGRELGVGPTATVVVYTKDDDGNVTSIEEVWYH